MEQSYSSIVQKQPKRKSAPLKNNQQQQQQTNNNNRRSPNLVNKKHLMNDMPLKRPLNAGARSKKLVNSKNTSIPPTTRNKKRANSGSNTSPRQMQNGRPRQNQRQMQNGTPSASGNRATGEPLKFDSEFDFEQANQRFTEEIEKGMDKLKVADIKTEKKTDEKDTSLTTSVSQELQDQAHIMMKQKNLESMDLHKELQKQMDQKMLSKEEQDVKDFYDKNISFFDRISCESNDKMTTQKPKSWKEERKLNAETFGLTQRTGDKNYRNYNNYNRNYRNYNNNNNNRNMNNSLNNNNSNYRGNNNRQNYNNRPQSGNYNNNNRNNYNNNGFNRRQEVEVNGNSQRRFGSR
jgi:hypothetical protein